MSDLATIWQTVLPEVRNGVTGVGVWTALNAAEPVALEENKFVLGLPHGFSDLSGHLKMHATKLLIERMLTQQMGRPIECRVIDGTTEGDWEMTKRKEQEARKLQEQAITRARAELEAKTTWDSVFEGLSRRNAQVENKSLPQNRARFYSDAVDLIVTALKENPVTSDLDERNFARVIERLSQYAEVPSVLVAQAVLEKAKS
ncbi:MAG: hypothetical protein JNJ45_01245 [Chthonomonas sp.]|nr:hypothetical protein [Chthonomonas sp.]